MRITIVTAGFLLAIGSVAIHIGIVPATFASKPWTTDNGIAVTMFGVVVGTVLTMLGACWRRG